MYRRILLTKRYFCLVLATVAAVSLVSCASTDAERQSDTLKINVDRTNGLVCPPDHSIEIKYEISGGSSSTEVSCIPSGLWKAEAVEESSSKGKIIEE